MALGFYFAPAAMSAAQYDECIKRLAKAGAAHPRGRSYHVAFGTPDKLQVFDVWDSQASFEAFGRTLMPILQALGADPGQPAVAKIHSVIRPPARKPRARARAATRRPAQRRAGARRGKRARGK